LNIRHNADTAEPEARAWTQILNRYRQPNWARSVVELAITALPLVALWAAAWFAYSQGYWWASLLIAIPAAGFLVRLFMIQHDCSHGAFFSRKLANDWVGRVIGVLTMTPYDFWRRTHAAHHATSGNLDRRGLGDVDTLTVREYVALSRWGRLKYRLYRNPVVLFGLGPGYVFLLRQRLPFGLLRAGWRPWISTQATNAAIMSIAALLIWLIGVKAFFLIHLPIILLAATFGVWLFFVQHQFDGVMWLKQGDWSREEGALKGSSHLDLPQPLRWFTANIGIHHVHHLNALIPSYRLSEVLRDHPHLREVSRVGLWESFRCAALGLWDEQSQQLISFAGLRRLRRQAA
jgi:omega-6 fatty acid desaturase (delta-12 desaturase)